MSARTFYLVHDKARAGAHQAIDDPAYAGWKMKLTPPAKSRDQEERYHAMIGEIAKQYRFCGLLWDAEDMKRLLVDAFKRETANDPTFAEMWKQVGAISMAPSLDGTGTVMLGTQTRRFPKELATAFIDWLFAFAAENNVELSQ